MTNNNLRDKDKYIYFDTSIYNFLLDDPDKSYLIRIMREKNHIVIPSVVNLCEMLMTRDPKRKIGLIRIYEELRNNRDPLKPYTWLLRESVESIRRGNGEFKIYYPIRINDDTESICRDLISQNKIILEPDLNNARDYIQGVPEKDKPADEKQYFACIESENGTQYLINLFDSICNARNIGSRLNRDMKIAIIRSPLNPWKYYLESYLYLFYRRAFPKTNYRKYANPGPLDLQQCVYFFWAGKVVIEDNAFIEIAMQLRKLRRYNLEILSYHDFKQFLFAKEP